MTYDFLISGGDWSIGNDGDLSHVEDTAKLVQDILKIAVTPVGTNLSFPWYGSKIGKSLVGSTFDSEFTTTMAENQLQDAIKILAQTQQKQNSYQMLTAAEQIAAIKNIVVQRNPADPRFFSVLISVMSKALTIVSPEFQFSPIL